MASAGQGNHGAAGTAPPDALRVRLFGTLDVEGIARDGLGSRKQRSLLRLLATQNGAPVSTDRIVDCLWPEEPETAPANQISVLASRLRSLLGRERITRTDAGYVLHADWTDVEALG